MGQAPKSPSARYAAQKSPQQKSYGDSDVADSVEVASLCRPEADPKTTPNNRFAWSLVVLAACLAAVVIAPSLVLFFTLSSCNSSPPLLNVVDLDLAREALHAELDAGGGVLGVKEASALDLPTPHRGQPKVAFMFLTRGPLPMRSLWEEFLKGANGRASIYVHASTPGFVVDENVELSSSFRGRQIPGVRVTWGGMDMVRAERRLLAAALQDPTNQRFVLLSEDCVPIQSFEHVYEYLLGGHRSFITSHPSTWRYPGRKMMSTVPRQQYRKGSQWVALTREHALLLSNDLRYYAAFAETAAAIPDESYIQTVVPMLDPSGVEKRSVVFVEWPSVLSRHPRTFHADEVTSDLIRSIQNRTMPVEERVGTFWGMSKDSEPCEVNGERRPCFLFARKFPVDSIPKLMGMRDLLGY